MDMASFPAATRVLPQQQQQPPTNTIIIIGAGIVGTALAHYLSLPPTPDTLKPTILVLDRNLTNPTNSTTYAPGLVGQFNDSSILTRLATASVDAYRAIPNAFSPCGGLEVALSEAGLSILRGRAALAQSRGLAADLLPAEEMVRLAPEFVRADDIILGGLHFPTDGAADAVRIAAWFRAQAESRGVAFLEADVSRLVYSRSPSNGGVTGIETTNGQHLPCSKLVLATGIWTRNVMQKLGLNTDGTPPIPIIPVSHPYAYSRNRAPRSASLSPQPFVRWPELQIYARDHGTSDGIGTYDHAPLAIPDSTSLPSAGGSSNFPASFTRALETAIYSLPFRTRALFSTSSNSNPYANAIAGIFALTPDNLPLLGPLPSTPSIYLAAAIWVTHAAGCARVLADLLLLLVASSRDKEILAALDPGRFAGTDETRLREQALGNYNHIYRSGSGD